MKSVFEKFIWWAVSLKHELAVYLQNTNIGTRLGCVLQMRKVTKEHSLKIASKNMSKRFPQVRQWNEVQEKSWRSEYRSEMNNMWPKKKLRQTNHRVRCNNDLMQLALWLQHLTLDRRSLSIVVTVTYCFLISLLLSGFRIGWENVLPRVLWELSGAVLQDSFSLL